MATRTRSPRKPTPRTAAKRRPAPARKAPAPPLPAVGRHREILDAALVLIAEQGYAGASLRELARRVGMSQPSLYHYFASKQDLVLQILETYAAAMMELPPLPADMADLPRLIAAAVQRLYAGDQHPLFARVMFATARLDPRFGARCREIFVDRVAYGMRLLVAPYVARGEIAEPDAIDVCRLVVYAIGFRFMEERVLFDDRPQGPDLGRYIDFVVTTAERRIRELRAARAV